MASSTSARALAKAVEPLGALSHSALLDAAPDAIVVVGAEDRIVLVNTGTERLFGYPRAELVGGTIEAIIPGWAGSPHPDHPARYIADLRPRPMGAVIEMVGRRNDGSEFTAEVALSAIAVGEGMVVTAVIRDGTDRVREAHRQRIVQQRHQRARELETLGHLAGSIAHDFNNLLGVILNYANFVADEIGENEIARSDIRQIRAAAERAVSLTRELSLIGRRRGRDLQLLDLNTLVSDAEPLLSRTIGEHIDIIVRAAPELPPISADRSQLERMLVKLAANAGDAMPRGGTLTIETAVVDVDEENAELHANLQPGPYVTLSMTDTGEGMNSDVLAHAFEPFFTTRAAGERSGLGLATVDGIVTEVDGAVTLRSSEGLGTTAHVYLPPSV